jgi:hypothetical protein
MSFVPIRGFKALKQYQTLEELEEYICLTDSVEPTPGLCVDGLAQLTEENQEHRVNIILTWGSRLKDNVNTWENILENKWKLFKAILTRRQSSFVDYEYDSLEDATAIPKRSDPVFLEEIAYKLVASNEELLTFSAQGKARNTVMHEAAYSASPDLLQKLIQLCASASGRLTNSFMSFTTPDSDKKTPLRCLFHRKDTTQLKYLLNLVLGGVKNAFPDYDTLLYILNNRKFENKLEIIKQFVDSGRLTTESAQSVVTHMIEVGLSDSPGSLPVLGNLLSVGKINVDVINLAFSKSSPDVLDTLLARCLGSKTLISVEMIVKLIKRVKSLDETQESKFTATFHKALSTIGDQDLRHHKLLHLALTERIGPDLIKALLTKCPELVLESDEHKLTPMANTGAQQVEIRTLIASCILRLPEETLIELQGGDPQLTLKTIRHLLEGRIVQVGPVAHRLSENPFSLTRMLGRLSCICRSITDHGI